MKRLILSRHAKSSWNHPELRDIDRPLNKRGLKAAPIMGGVLRERSLIPEAIFASPSLRTRMTSELLAKELAFPFDQVEFIDSFYGASPGSIVQFTQKLDDQLSTVMLVGHNPTWTDLCHRLTGKHLDNLPTSGILVIDFDINHWSDLSDLGTTSALLIPRDFACGGGSN
ncbi:MAG: phosphohistidine phosphatase [Akkermansiaceae bacterium]|jgi:phosphohistidine phosphatase